MKGNDLPYKSRPAYLTMALGIMGLLFFGYWAYVIYNSIKLGKSTDGSTADIFVYAMFGLFIIFGLGTFWLTIGMQLYLITESELIITRPLFFGGSKILITDIESIEESDNNIKIMNDSITGTTVFTGRKAILILKSGKKIKISSYAVGGYNMLITKLRKQRIKVVADAIHHFTK
jgi:hypothetical protein